ncbi:hypothetical protein ACHAXS_013011 [Conticribra weissflogii]
MPSDNPTSPTISPTDLPSLVPSMSPSAYPTRNVTKLPTLMPSVEPSQIPSIRPSSIPSQAPSFKPSSKPSSAPSKEKKLVNTYFCSWQWYDRNKLARPKNFDFSKVDRVNFAFFQTNEKGDIFGTDSWADPQLLFGPYNWNGQGEQNKHCSWDGPSTRNCRHHEYEHGLINLAHAAGAQVFPSIGGWTLSDAFVGMAANPSSRQKFAKNCADLITSYGFDGIDLDWEYPGYKEHSGTENDIITFSLLLEDVRAELDKLEDETGQYYKLTAALPCGPHHMININIPHINSVLDELNVMSYDFHGSWSDTTGVAAPLFHQGWGEADFSVDDCVRNWVDGGASREKINLGLAFYGRSFASATGMNEPHDGADNAHWAVDEGTPQYYNIVAKLPSMVVMRDDTTMTPYAYFPSGGLVSFDDERSICEKTEYTVDNDLNGFLIWEISGDLMPDLSTPLLDTVNSKLHTLLKSSPLRFRFRNKLDNPGMLCSGDTQSSTTTTSSTVPNGTGATVSGPTYPVTTSTSSSSSITTNSCNRPSTCASYSISCGANNPCPNGMCCSQWGYCGRGWDYCGGDCCQNGPCDNGCR